MAAALLLWPPAVAYASRGAGSLLITVGALQLLATCGALQLAWPAGAAGFYVGEMLGALRAALQEPHLSMLSCSEEFGEDAAWVVLQLLPLLQLAALGCWQLAAYAALRCALCMPHREAALRMAPRLRASAGYWLRLLWLQWPGLVLRGAMRLACEAEPWDDDDDAGAHSSLASATAANASAANVSLSPLPTPTPVANASLPTSAGSATLASLGQL
eukprot:170316-Prymnesium_polylepis.1